MLDELRAVELRGRRAPTSASAASTSPRLPPTARGRCARSCDTARPTGRYRSSTSYSTSTSAAASRAAWRVSAATTASTSPTYAVSSPTATSWRQSCVSAPCVRSPGTSAAVSTATTPGCAFAFAVSMLEDPRPRMVGEAERTVQQPGHAHVGDELLVAEGELDALVAGRARADAAAVVELRQRLGRVCAAAANRIASTILM